MYHYILVCVDLGVGIRNNKKYILKMIETGKIINGDCVEVMKTLPEGSVDLVVTSPPYGVGIAYDVHEDDVEFNEYLEFAKSWLTEAYKVLKDDGRIALNIPYEINRQKKGGRIFFVSEMWQIMKEIGYGFFGIVDLEEQSPHRSKTTAWGSWMSPSSPYIYNPKECVILAYKKKHIKKVGFLLLAVIFVLVGKYIYDMNINHNFETITEGKVYKSGVIPPNEIESYVKKYHIKSIVD